MKPLDFARLPLRGRPLLCVRDVAELQQQTRVGRGRMVKNRGVHHEKVFPWERVRAAKRRVRDGGGCGGHGAAAGWSWNL